VWLRELDDNETVLPRGEDELIAIDRRATLNDALDSMLNSSFGAAVVTGPRDEYQGVVDFGAVTAFVAATEDRHAADEGADD
jgi:osmoprotectant transport system ATP-binding protein